MSSLIFFNANVITMDPLRPRAGLVAIEGDRIISVAGYEMLGRLKKKQTQTIDCAGRTLMPGFIDAHCHIQAYAEGLVSLSLSPGDHVNSISDIQQRIRICCNNQPAGTWIRGKGYDEFHLAEQRHPNRWDLDTVAQNHHVRLTHRSGHAQVLNSPALKCVGITAETGDPPGGLIDRDPETGEPTGILYDMGGYLAGKIPPVENSEMERGIALANEKLLSCGITSIQDATSHNDLRQWRLFESWKAQEILQPRLTMMRSFKDFAASKTKSYSSQVRESELKLGSVKIIIDQVSGSLHPSQRELNERIAAIHEAGHQAAVHAVEEPVIEAACNAIEHALNLRPQRNHRHRIEHCSVGPPSLLSRLARLGITVVTQPAFIYFSGERYLKTVPADQLKHLYPIGSMLRNGLPVGGSSDFPISDPNPLLGIHAAITRMTKGGDTIFPPEAVSVADALKM